MRCIYAVSNPPYIFPISGGYMEQDPYFLEALEIFRAAPHKFKTQKENNTKALQKLGAIK